MEDRSGLHLVTLILLSRIEMSELNTEVASRRYWRQINYKITTNWISATPPETVIISTATITRVRVGSRRQKDGERRSVGGVTIQLFASTLAAKIVMLMTRTQRKKRQQKSWIIHTSPFNHIQNGLSEYRNNTHTQQKRSR